MSVHHRKVEMIQLLHVYGRIALFSEMFVGLGWIMLHKGAYQVFV